MVHVGLVTQLLEECMVHVELVTQLLEVYGSFRVGYTTVRRVHGFPFACYV